MNQQEQNAREIMRGRGCCGRVADGMVCVLGIGHDDGRHENEASTFSLRLPMNQQEQNAREIMRGKGCCGRVIDGMACLLGIGHDDGKHENFAAWTTPAFSFLEGHKLTAISVQPLEPGDDSRCQLLLTFGDHGTLLTTTHGPVRAFAADGSSIAFPLDQKEIAPR